MLVDLLHDPSLLYEACHKQICLEEKNWAGGLISCAAYIKAIERAKAVALASLGGGGIR